MSKFAERLRSLREARGLRTEDLAKRLNISRSTIGMYEQGRREPSLDKLQEMAVFFDVTIDYLVGRTNDSSKTYSPVTRELLDMLHMTDDEIFAKGPHTLDGKVLTKEEFKTIITAIRLKRELDQK